MKYTVGENRKIYAGNRLAAELFYSQEFDDAVTPPEIGFQTVRDQLDKWAEEETVRLTALLTPAEQKPSEPTPTPADAAPPEKHKVTSMKDVAKAFPPDLAGLLHLEVTDKYVLVKPRQYLASDSFRRVAAVVRDRFDGEYVSAGKDSHWRILRRSLSPDRSDQRRTDF